MKEIILTVTEFRSRISWAIRMVHKGRRVLISLRGKLVAELIPPRTRQGRSR